MLLAVVSPAFAARTWTDSTGKYRVEAEFDSVAGAAVRLRRADGVLVQIPWERLSPGDRDFLRRQGKGPPEPPAAGPTAAEGLALCRSGQLTEGLAKLRRCSDAGLAEAAGLEIALRELAEVTESRGEKMRQAAAQWKDAATRGPPDARDWMLTRSQQWRTRADLWKLVAWAEGKRGQKIGNGQCTEVPAHAMQAAQSTTREGWGRRLAETETPYPGDVLRMVAARGPGFWTEAQHLLIIKDVLGPKRFSVYHQNWGGRQVVMVGEFDLNTLQAGSFEIYRPEFAGDAPEEKPLR